MQLTTSNGSTHLVSLGVYPDRVGALTRSIPLLLGASSGSGSVGSDDDAQFEGLLVEAPSVRTFRP
ncbi:hypothetical protein [Cryobacterium sp. Y62]|uniref:hypothetical protein n=1 Tax=Cryobacterium sp. Y62 TaxID=2048284 RepID=UPI0011B0D3A7|nr:hypothetical protein [Cryobacterium sp. Y62]